MVFIGGVLDVVNVGSVGTVGPGVVGLVVVVLRRVDERGSGCVDTATEITKNNSISTSSQSNEQSFTDSGSD